MANRTIAVHTSESNIERLDEQAKWLRRSRNSLINEAIEMLLEHHDGVRLVAATGPAVTTATKKMKGQK